MLFKRKKPLVHLDEPKTQLFSQSTRFSGWYAGDNPISDISILGRRASNVDFHNREDVEKAHPEFKNITGFTFLFPTDHLPGCSKIEILATSTKNEEARSEFTLDSNPAFEMKSRKLSELKKLLDLSRKHSLTETAFDFTTDETLSKAGAVESTAVSSHNYTPEMIQLIESVPQDGWTLDCGAGYRETKYENVVHFEIEPYVSTDVRGVCESLPFKDNSFDLVLSIVVLEHVRDPQKAVSEMVRVLKPGGKIWVDVAFMQPFHGYPNHFFNMTRNGLRSLFSGEMKIDREFIPNYGTPIWSLTWFLQKYAQGLPEEARSDFEGLTVRDLLESPEKLLEQAWVANLSAEATEHLAATNSLIATKLT